MAKNKPAKSTKKRAKISLPKRSTKAKSKKSKKDDGKRSLLKRILWPTYFKESFRELKKVAWPSRKESIKLTFAVIVFTVFLTIVISISDYGLEQLVERIFL